MMTLPQVKKERLSVTQAQSKYVHFKWIMLFFEIFFVPPKTFSSYFSYIKGGVVPQKIFRFGLKLESLQICLEQRALTLVKAETFYVFNIYKNISFSSTCKMCLEKNPNLNLNVFF